VRRIELLCVVCTLVVSGCFDDAITIGLDCENELECGEGQVCGPGVLEDNGSPTPGQVCGIPAAEGWESCQDGAPTICGDDFETALICRDGFRTETDCDVVCEAQVGSQRHDGVCGQLVPETDADCACAYAIDELPDGAGDCVRTDAGLDVVRSKAFGSDDVAAYLQTCDEWCELQSGFSIYEGSVCTDTFEELLSGLPMLISAAVLEELDRSETCVCRLAEEPSCGGVPDTRCLAQDAATSAVAVCGSASQALIQCSNGCGPIGTEMLEFDWCL